MYLDPNKYVNSWDKTLRLRVFLLVRKNTYKQIMREMGDVHKDIIAWKELLTNDNNTEEMNTYYKEQQMLLIKNYINKWHLLIDELEEDFLKSSPDSSVFQEQEAGEEIDSLEKIDYDRIVAPHRASSANAS